MQCMEAGLTRVIFLPAVNSLYTRGYSILLTVLQPCHKYHLILSQYMCVNITGSKVHEDQVYPEQMLKVPVVLYGQRNGSVPGIVHGELVNKSRGAHFAPLKETQQTEYSCKNLTYTIFSNGHHKSILLRVDDVQYYEEKAQPLVNVTLLLCPPGFQLSNLSAQCECNPLLKDRGLSCNISGAIPLVHRTKSVWISIHPNRNDTILHDNCPLDYCKPTSFWLQLEHPCR